MGRWTDLGQQTENFWVLNRDKIKINFKTQRPHQFNNVLTKSGEEDEAFMLRPIGVDEGQVS